jgi:FHS family Na+ dependent glucose MFS transporter 1
VVLAVFEPPYMYHLTSMLWTALLSEAVSDFYHHLHQTFTINFNTLYSENTHANAFVSGGNPSLASLWLDKAAGPYNFLHSGFGFGAAIAPLIAEPFLVDDLDESALNVTQPQSNVTVVTPAVELSRIEFPYGIVGVICYVTAACFFLFYVFRSRTPRLLVPRQQKDGHRAAIFDPKTCAGGDRTFGGQMFVLIFLYYMLLVGGERAYGKFVYSYARESDLAFTRREAAWLNTMYWISFTLARVVAYIAARWVPIHVLLFIQVTGTAISAILLNAFHSNYVMFWLTSFTLGFFKAPLFPSGLGWINRYLRMTSMLIMVVNIGSSTGGMLIQWLTGYLFEYYGPRSFLYTVLAYSLLLFAMFAVMHVVGRRHGERFQDGDERGTSEELAAGEDETREMRGKHV